MKKFKKKKNPTVTKLKKSNCDQTKKNSNGGKNSKTQTVKKLKNTICEKTQKLKW